VSESPGQPRRFVVLRHQRGPDVHWDVMIEDGDHLATWRMDRPPHEVAAEPVPLVRIQDHPLRFLTYTGPVQKGMGHVDQADAGTCVFEGHLPGGLVRLSGQHLRGTFRLEPVRDSGWALQQATDAGTPPKK